ncbi:MAG: cell division protein FtsQ/DivIB [Dysgonamonadaceae bacterium]|jgi:cell division protein FtsQ|nr:cell division protein FtsQ/DivIB [Dysgonamonadaceae bacterium]
MLKKIIQVTIVAALLIYLAFAVAFINPKADADLVCSEVRVEVVKNHGISYLSENQVLAILQQPGINPVNKKMSSVSIEKIDKVLKDNKLIKSAESYKTIDGKLKIKIYQYYPILRVISNTGNYYVDIDGDIMPVPKQFAAHLPLATGAISEEYAKNQLFTFAQFLRKNKTWNEQIEQINILPNQDVELIPLKGNHTILLGKMENYRENLDKLKLFYDKALDQVGWNRYSMINLKYENQVVCTKKNKQ